MAIASEDLPGPLTFTNFGPAKARPLHHVDAAPNPTLIPLNLAGLRRGLARLRICDPYRLSRSPGLCRGLTLALRK